MGNEITRRLATVEKVLSCVKHPNADRLNIITVRGWQCVTTAYYNPGDLVIYFEIDSFLPIEPMYEFMRKSSYRNIQGLGEGFRVKTIRLRGELSQGLALPLNEVMANYVYLDPLVEGTDLTEFLNVKKYEQPLAASLAGKVAGHFPSFIPKTDQERIQNLYGDLVNPKPLDLTNIPEEYREAAELRHKKKTERTVALVDETFEITLKLDGSSCTIFYNEGEYGVCSRNYQLDLDDTENAFVKIALKYKDAIIDYCTRTESNLAFQGELMGPGIQGNREKLSDVQLFIFDVYDIDAKEYMDPQGRWGTIGAINFIAGDPAFLAHIPVVEQSKRPFKDFTSVADFIAYADRKSLTNDIAEGVVFKSHDTDLSFKVINNKFLEQEKD